MRTRRSVVLVVCFLLAVGLAKSLPVPALAQEKSSDLPIDVFVTPVIWVPLRADYRDRGARVEPRSTPQGGLQLALRVQNFTLGVSGLFLHETDRIKSNTPGDEFTDTFSYDRYDVDVTAAYTFRDVIPNRLSLTAGAALLTVHLKSDDICEACTQDSGNPRDSGRVHDTDPWKIETTGVAVADMLGKVAKISAKRLFVVIDTCYSGSVSQSWGARTKTFAFGPTTRAAAPLPSEIYDAVRAQRGHFVVSASRPDEPSLELESLGHGLFTYFLLEALEGAAARPGNSFVSIVDLYDYVSNRVGAFAKTLNQKQTPMMSGNFDGPPPFVTIVGHATAPKPSEFERLVREARLSFESSRVFVEAPKEDRVEMFVAGALYESWRGAMKEVRIPREVFDRHGHEVTVVLRASRDGRLPDEKTFRLVRGDERRVVIESGQPIPPPARRLPPPVFPPPAP